MKRHLSLDALLELAADPAASRPRHLQSCPECAAELQRLTSALAIEPAETELAAPPLAWMMSLVRPLESADEISLLLFGQVKLQPDISALHPWFRDFLGDEPAACLTRSIASIESCAPRAQV